MDMKLQEQERHRIPVDPRLLSFFCIVPRYEWYYHGPMGQLIVKEEIVRNCDGCHGALQLRKYVADVFDPLVLELTDQVARLVSKLSLELLLRCRRVGLEDGLLS
jgi:hypothetical protein